MKNDTFKPAFLMLPTEILHDERVGDGDAIVYGVIYWYHSLKDGRCTASNQAIATQARKSNRTIEAILTRLDNAGHIKRIYDDTGKRVEIKPLTSMGYVKSSRPVRKVTENPTQNHVQRDNSIKNKNILLTQSDFVRILTAYVNIKKLTNVSSSDRGRIGKAAKLLMASRMATADLIIKGFEWLARQDFSWTAETLDKQWHNFIKDANILPSNKEVWTNDQWADYIRNSPTTGIRCARQVEYGEHCRRQEGT